jgi:uncharacterized protein
MLYRILEKRAIQMRFFLSLVLLAPLCAQETTRNSIPSILVHGEATVSANPDEANIDIGIVSQAPTSQAAADLNAKQSDTVMQALRALVPPSNVKTENFAVNPNYRYPKDGGAPTILGYTANNTVRVVLDDISKLRKVIDAATQAGASNVNRLTFTLHDEKAVRARALAEAARQAHAGAEALAVSLKVKLGRLLRVEEGQPVIVSPAREIELGKAESTDQGPILPGNIEVHANVKLTFELLQ